MALPRDPFTHFRRALSKRDQGAFDRLMERAVRHEDSKIMVFKVGTLLQGIDPVEVVFLSILLEHEKEIIELRSRSMEKPWVRRGAQGEL